MLVRSWNLYHGRSHPPGEVDHLEQAVRLACTDRPDVLCLQEVPPWALAHLPDWTGLLCFGEITRRPSFGPLPISCSLGQWLTSLDPRRFRSAFSGQANAILVRRELLPREHSSLHLNSRSFRRRFDDQLSWRERWAWARERRRCQTVRLTLPDGRPAILANLHATSRRSSPRSADLELERAVARLERLARAGEVIILAGDFNLDPAHSQTFDALAQLGFSLPGPAIDHVLVRGADVSPPSVWPPERRRRAGVLLSDHAPVELTLFPVAASAAWPSFPGRLEGAPSSGAVEFSSLDRFPATFPHPHG